KHDVHHADAAHHQSHRADDAGQYHQRSGELVPEVAEKVRRAELKIVFLAGWNLAQAAHSLNHLVLRLLYADALGNGEGQDQLFRLRISFLEIAQWRDGEHIHAWPHEQPLVVLKDTDDFIDASVNAHLFADGIGIWEKRLADGCAQHH